MAGIKWWRRVIFYAELNSSGRSLACDFGNDAKPKIDACGHTTRRNDVAIFHRSCVFVCGSDERQKIGIGPVRRSPSPLQQTSHTQNKCAQANRGDVLCGPRFLTDELDRLTIIDNIGNALASARYTDQVERRTIRKGVRRHETKSAIARNWRR